MIANNAQSDLSLVGNSVIQAADALGLAREQLANTIGVSTPTVARMKKGAAVPARKPYELSLMLIRIYRALFSIVGGKREAMKHWMQTPNDHFSGQVPADMVQKPEGIAQVIWYLDAMRGRI